MLDQDGNPIVSEGDEGGDDEGGENFESLKSELEKAKADAEKRKNRFKGAKAEENKSPKGLDQEAVKRMVDESVGVVKFYSDNKDANQYQQDIEALVAKGIERDKAFKYVVAEKDPSLLLDEAKRAQLSGNTALNGVPAQINGKPNPKAMSEEEIAKLSDKEFEEAFPSSASPKKFYAE